MPLRMGEASRVKAQLRSIYHECKVAGEQRYKYRLCDCQFVPTREKDMTAKQKALALCLYTNGLSFRAIGKIIRVHFSAVC